VFIAAICSVAVPVLQIIVAAMLPMVFLFVSHFAVAVNAVRGGPLSRRKSCKPQFVDAAVRNVRADGSKRHTISLRFLDVLRRQLVL
jgi:hypothetical protein